MAFRALVPFSFVISTVYREIALVVLSKIKGRPTSVGGVADNAVRRKIAGFVIGACSCLKIRGMASKTVGGCICKITPDMALRTIVDLVSFRQWEEKVICATSRPKPIRTRWIMAIFTICRVACRFMVGHRRRRIVFEVTIDTMIADPVKPQSRLRAMAVGAIG